MIDIFNGYCTLSDFKKTITPADQTLNIDAADDDVIKDLIEVASRRVDALTARKFYPHISTRSYDLPYENIIWFGDDLLEVIEFLNGDGTAIADTEYILKPANDYPKYALQLRDVSQILLISNSSESDEQVLDLSAYWGFHDEYDTRAWRQVGTLGAAWASTTTLTATLTAGHTMDQYGGEIIKIDDELFNTVSVAGNVLSVIMRGDNGSTAATHLINAPVYRWHTPRDISRLTLEIAHIMYNSRYGVNVETTSTYTPAGVVVSPRSLPVWAQEILRKYQRTV
jgi:hypothetical protein